MADHEHSAYEVWDGASHSDISHLQSLIDRLREELREDLRRAEARIQDLEYDVRRLEAGQ